MLVIGLLATIGLAAIPPAWQSRTAALGVGATVVRPPAQPTIAMRDGEALLRNPDGASVSVTGGVLRRHADGTIRIQAARGATTRVTITY